MTCLVSWLIFYSCIKVEGISIRHVMILGVILLFLAGAVGATRNQLSNFIFSRILENILGESLLTVLSAVAYMSYYSPVNFFYPFGTIALLFTGLINLIPTFFFAEKALYMYDVFELYPHINVFAARHFFLTFNGGFGIIPSIIFFLILGRILGNLYKNLRYKNVAYKTIYCLITANLTFTLYRDPFNTSIIKNIFELSIFLPYFIVLLGKCITHYHSRVNT